MCGLNSNCRALDGGLVPNSIHPSELPINNIFISLRRRFAFISCLSPDLIALFLAFAHSFPSDFPLTCCPLQLPNLVIWLPALCFAQSALPPDLCTAGSLPCRSSSNPISQSGLSLFLNSVQPPLDTLSQYLVLFSKQNFHLLKLPCLSDDVFIKHLP